MHKKTILSPLVLADRRWQAVLGRRGLRPRYVQLDELWTFVHTEDAHLRSDEPVEWGEAYTRIALDPDTKLSIPHPVADQDRPGVLLTLQDDGVKVCPRWPVEASNTLGPGR